MIIDVTRGQKRAFIPLYIEKKMEIWSGDTDSQTLKERATKLLRSKSGPLVTHFVCLAKSQSWLQ